MRPRSLRQCYAMAIASARSQPEDTLLRSCQLERGCLRGSESAVAILDLAFDRRYEVLCTFKPLLTRGHLRRRTCMHRCGRDAQPYKAATHDSINTSRAEHIGVPMLLSKASARHIPEKLAWLLHGQRQATNRVITLPYFGAATKCIAWNETNSDSAKAVSPPWSWRTSQDQGDESSRGNHWHFKYPDDLASSRVNTDAAHAWLRGTIRKIGKANRRTKRRSVPILSRSIRPEENGPGQPAGAHFTNYCITGLR